MFEQKLLETGDTPFRYLRTTDLLRAEVIWNLPDSTKVLFFGENEAELFIQTMRRRNVVARLGGLNNNYLRRAAELTNRTVIEVIGRATPETMLATGERSAELVEQLAVLSTVLVNRRNDLQRKLGMPRTTTSEVNLAV